MEILPKYFNKKISTPIGITVILFFALLAGGFLFWQYSRIPEHEFPSIQFPSKSEKQVTITTDKTEYEQGEMIQITIKNNSDKEILGGYHIFYDWALEKLEGDSWKKFPVLWKSEFDEEKRKYCCRFFSPEQPVGVKKWSPYSGEVRKWDSRICSPGLYEEPTLIEEGIYRLVFTYSIYKEGQIPKAGYYSGWDMEDPKVIYSNEFRIREK